MDAAVSHVASTRTEAPTVPSESLPGTVLSLRLYTHPRDSPRPGLGNAGASPHPIAAIRGDLKSHPSYRVPPGRNYATSQLLLISSFQKPNLKQRLLMGSSQ